MRLLTDKQKANIATKYPIKSQDSKERNAICVAKFFLGSWTWYILEGEIENDGDFLMFGIVINGMGDEYGYVSFNELEKIEIKVKTPFGILPLKVERDIYMKPCPLDKIHDHQLQQFLNRLYPKEEKAMVDADCPDPEINYQNN